MITAKVIQHTKAIRHFTNIVTFELEYPRFIHGELMTHRVFSRNAASSRAVPISKVIDHVLEDTAMPVHWGKNQKGMQAKEEISCIGSALTQWYNARDSAITHARALDKLGLHKQVVNRILEPFQTMKTVVTATEFENFFELRCHEDAQPEIRELAKKMRTALKESKPFIACTGDWHVPYVDRIEGNDGVTRYYSNDSEVSVEDAIKISASCCAQVSYRLLDTSLEKARNIYTRLVESKPIHASPFEHQAQAQIVNYFIRNFRGWKQHRAFIEEELTNV